MAPQITVGMGGAERSCTITVVGPAARTQTVATCSSLSTSRDIDYQGNGAYAVTVAVYTTLACTDAPAVTPYTFTVAAGVAFGGTSGVRVLTREPGEYTTNEHRLPLTGNPGATAASSARPSRRSSTRPRPPSRSASAFAIRAFAPFDFSSSTFPDSRGPSYRLQVRLREETARGRVRIRVARNWTGRARYRTIGRVRIRRTVRFSAADGADHTLTAVE